MGSDEDKGLITRRIRIGTMGWSYSFWVGNFYPKGLATDGFLTEYSKHFDTVEVDNTFYKVPSKSTVVNWREQTPADFLFSIKFPRVVTHDKMLVGCEQDVQRFLEAVSSLKDKLGPLLLQFSFAFKPQHLPILNDFLRALPTNYRYAVEVRNKNLLNARLYSILRDNNVALALVERPFMPKIEEVTTDFTYVRWEGDRKKVKGTLARVELDRTNEIKHWAERIGRFRDASIRVFGYFSKYYSGHPAIDAKLLQRFLPN